jgi:guanylate kinase
LVNRKTESEDSLNKRVTKGIEEMKEARGIDIYDFLVNDELDSSFKSFE